MDEIDHPVFAHAKRIWQAGNDPKLERISSIDDNIFFKCKPNVPLRGAMWLEKNAKDKAWLVAAGPRSEGSRGDFYEALQSTCARNLARARISRSNFKLGKNTYSDHLLPEDDDRKRLELERNLTLVLEADQKILDMVRKAQESPTSVFATEVYGCKVETMVEKSEFQELYVHIMIIGSAPKDAMSLILSVAVPEAHEEDWDFLEEAPVGMESSGGMYCYTLLAPGWRHL